MEQQFKNKEKQFLVPMLVKINAHDALGFDNGVVL